MLFRSKVISSIVMNLVGLISAEFSQKAKSERDKYITQPLGYNLQGMGRVGKEKSHKQAATVDKFAQQENADNSEAITFAKLQAYRQQKEQQLIKPAKIVNTVSQLAVFGGFGLILLGTALILSGVGIIPGLAVMGAGGMLATGGFAGIVVTDAKVIRFDSSSRNSNQKMRLLMQRDQNSNSDNVLSEDISSMPEDISDMSEDISDMSEDISDMSEERQRDHGNTKQTTWGQWIRSGFGLFKVSQSEMSQGDSRYDTSDEQPKLLR